MRSATISRIAAWMGAAVTFLAANPCFADAARPAVTSQTVSFHSKALARETTYCVFMPSALEPGQRLPVLYLLHGYSGSYQDWSQRTPLAEMLSGRRMIVVTPDGGFAGWYVDSPLQPDSNYETFITRDLVEDVDTRFPTARAREARGIAGLSMGGHGALLLAVRHPELYASASSLSGILRITNHHGKWKTTETLGELPAHATFWKEHSVCDLADRFTSAGLSIMFDIGTGDKTGAVTDNRQFHERLTNRAIVHRYSEHPGGHTWQYWGEHLPEHLDFHQSAFAAYEAGKPPVTGASVADRFHQLYVDRCLMFERENDERASRGDPGTSPTAIVLLGSSSMQRIIPGKMFPGYDMVNRGIGADRIGLGDRGILHRLYCSALDCRPRAVFVLNGTNDLGMLSRTGKPTVEETAQCFAEVIGRIRAGAPDAHVFIVSCSPTRDRYARIAPFIPQYNALLRKLAEGGDPMVSYVDTYSDLVGDDRLTIADYTNDGLHLNAGGNRILKQKFLEAMTAAGIGAQAEPEESGTRAN